MPNKYVQSGYERKPNDDYQTIDARCVQALVDCVHISGDIVDICASHGSGIVTSLNDFGFTARGLGEAEDFDRADWIVTNPPYDRRYVNNFIDLALDAIKDRRCLGAAFLMRANFDLAATRAYLFDDRLYRGQVRMRFRPWWTEERRAQPIHNFVWHVWDREFGTDRMLTYWPKSN